MDSIEEKDYSGNIKLRLPKSLHKSLSEQAIAEGISLNQFCLMLLSKGLNSNYLGTYEFNNILAKIYRESNNDLNQIYQQLYYLNTRVEALIPLLKQDLNSLFESNKRDINSSIETLRSIYPIYPGTIQNEDYPFIKIPSIKVVLQPIGSFL